MKGFINGDWHAWTGTAGKIMLSDESKKVLRNFPNTDACINWLYVNGEVVVARALNAHIAVQKLVNKPSIKTYTPPVRRFHWVGDRYKEQGGYFMTTNNREHGYSEVVRITPCSDAGGPDNLFWIERITVNVPDNMARLAMALEVIGMDAESYALAKPVQRWNIAVEASIAAGWYDQDGTTVVQVGKAQPAQEWRHFDLPAVDVQLRGNASIGAYALNVAKEI